MYKLSIVTICFNNPQDVITSCASVDMQTTKPFEHLIIDGSSKPGVKEWLEGNKQPAYRRWICERDKGIADAFNKGIRNAKGDIIYLLNSGDKIYDQTVLEKVMGTFERDASIGWVNGKLQIFRAGMWTTTGKPFEKSKLYRGMHGIFHPTMYVKKEVYDRHGEYDLNIKYAMDYDYLCRLADEKSAFIDAPLAIFDPTGRSSTEYEASTKEMFACYRKYFGQSLKQTLWGWRLMASFKLLNSPVGAMLYKLKVAMGMQKV